MSADVVLDLFAGPGGWSQACKALGMVEHGVELDPYAVATRTAAGHETVGRDVWDFAPTRSYSGLIASPPCQTFSLAGHGSGRKALDDVLALIGDGSTWMNRERLRAAAGTLGDERTALVLSPLHYVWALGPDWAVWEQVPTVLPVWEACAPELEAMGYRVWTGNVQAEQYGVPQTRRRAVLIASRNGQPERPAPTHSKYYARTPDKLDPGVKPWVSMAEALGLDSEVAHDGAVEREAFTELGQERTYRASVADDKPWTRIRPATTLAGRGLVPDPGANANRFNGSTKSRNDGVRVTAAQAGVLQTFPASYPWAGTATKQFEQVGNAIPPLLAEAVLREALRASQEAPAQSETLW